MSMTRPLAATTAILLAFAASFAVVHPIPGLAETLTSLF